MVKAIEGGRICIRDCIKCSLVGSLKLDPHIELDNRHAEILKHAKLLCGDTTPCGNVEKQTSVHKGVGWKNYGVLRYERRTENIFGKRFERRSSFSYAVPSSGLIVVDRSRLVTKVFISGYNLYIMTGKY